MVAPTRRSDAYRPATLRSLPIDGYAAGCYASRKIERATDDSMAFLFISCNRPPDRDILATLRRRFAARLAAVFLQVLQIARENQLGRFGTVSLDGTKIRANVSGLAEGEARQAARRPGRCGGRDPQSPRDDDPARLRRPLNRRRSTVFLLDRAYIDTPFWDAKKRALGSVMIARLKSNLRIDSTEDLGVDSSPAASAARAVPTAKRSDARRVARPTNPSSRTARTGPSPSFATPTRSNAECCAS